MPIISSSHLTHAAQALRPLLGNEAAPALGQAAKAISTSAVHAYKGELSSETAKEITHKVPLARTLLGAAQFQHTSTCHGDHGVLLNSTLKKAMAHSDPSASMASGEKPPTTFMSQLKGLARELLSPQARHTVELHSHDAQKHLKSPDALKSLLAERGAVVISGYGLSAEDSLYNPKNQREMLPNTDHHSKILLDVHTDPETGRDMIVSLDLDNTRDTPLSNQLRDQVGGMQNLHKLSPSELAQAQAERVLLQKEDAEEFLDQFTSFRDRALNYPPGFADTALDLEVMQPTLQIPTEEAAEALFGLSKEQTNIESSVDPEIDQNVALQVYTPPALELKLYIEPDRNHPLRQAYVAAVKELGVKAEVMQSEGRPSEEIARAMHAERREIASNFKDITPPETLALIKTRNLEKYGDALGPSIDYLRNVKHKTWDDIISSALRTGGNDLNFERKS